MCRRHLFILQCLTLSKRMPSHRCALHALLPTTHHQCRFYVVCLPLDRLRTLMTNVKSFPRVSVGGLYCSQPIIWSYDPFLHSPEHAPLKPFFEAANRQPTPVFIQAYRATSKVMILKQAKTYAWDFRDLRMLVSSNLAIFGDSNHPAVSLHVREDGFFIT